MWTDPSDLRNRAPRISIVRLPTLAVAIATMLGACGASDRENEVEPGAPRPESVAVESSILEEFEVKEGRIEVTDGSIAYLEARPTGAADEGDALGVLLLHGRNFTRRTWEELGTLDVLGRAGWRVVALDLPGFGDSTQGSPASTGAGGPGDTPGDLGRIVEEALLELGFDSAVVVAPSMSGCYVLPLLQRGSNRIGGVVPVGPACASEFVGPCSVPALVIRGAEDVGFRGADAEALRDRFSKARVETFPSAGHPCYLDDPEHFHQLLIEFVAEVLGG